MSNKLTFLLPVLGILACSGSSEQVEKKDSAIATPKPTSELAPVKPDNMVAGDANSLVQEVNRNAVLLFGKYVESNAANLHSNLRQVAPALNNSMAAAKVTGTGPMVLVYPKIPTNGATQTVFVGLPVNKKFAAKSGDTFLQIPKATFYKMRCNAEVGNTISGHMKMQKFLKEKSLAFGAPVMEVFTESRNNEMTVVSMADLFYIKK